MKKQRTKWLKSVLALSLALAMLLQGIPFAALNVSAAETAGGTGGTNGGLTWSLDEDGTLTISGTDEIGSYEDWKDYGDAVTKLVIEEGVTGIDDFAFWYCENLASIEIPDSVTYIGRSVFTDTAYILDSDNWEDGLFYIGSWLISSDYDQVSGSVSIKEGTVGIAERGMALCDSMTSVTLPSSLAYIGEAAFYGCDGLADDDGFIIVNNVLFGYCGDSETVTVPDGVTGIDAYVFCYNTVVTDVALPDSVTEIGYAAFYECENLEQINLPDSITQIGDYAFAYCVSLKSVVIPSGMTEIGLGVFSGCTAMTSLTIPEGVETIGAAAFRGCDSLVSVVIPDSVTRIASGSTSSIDAPPSKRGGGGGSGSSMNNGAFSYCTSLESIQLPAGLTAIEERAFVGCESLKEIDIPDGVAYIGSAAFSECCSLERVTIPGSVKTIGDEYAYYISAYEIGAFAGCYSLTDLTIENGVTSIGAGSFYGCSSLETVELPNSITFIGDWAFYGTNSLTSITIPGAAAYIGEAAVGTQYYWDEEAEEGGYLAIEGFVIYGYDDTAAETYATENSITFVSLGEYVGVSYGDVDGDGDIDVTDALMILQNYVKLISIDDSAAAAADVDGDGDVDVTDALTVLQYYVKLIDSFPVE